MMGMLLPLGIEKGKEFKPDAATVAQLKAAAAEAQAWLINGLVTAGKPWWPGSQWSIPGPPIGFKTQGHWEVPHYFDVDSRGIAFSTFFCPPARSPTGFTPPPVRNGSRGSASMARRRRSWTRAGRCRTSKK